MTDQMTFPSADDDMNLDEAVEWAEKAILTSAKVQGGSEEHAARQVFGLASKIVQCCETVSEDNDGRFTTMVQKDYVDGQMDAVENALEKAGVEIV
jgi:hypothetical protein